MPILCDQLFTRRLALPHDLCVCKSVDSTILLVRVPCQDNGISIMNNMKTKADSEKLYSNLTFCSNPQILVGALEK
jgi:hypothetical protein